MITQITALHALLQQFKVDASPARTLGLELLKLGGQKESDKDERYADQSQQLHIAEMPEVSSQVHFSQGFGVYSQV